MKEILGFRKGERVRGDKSIGCNFNYKIINIVLYDTILDKGLYINLIINQAQ